MFNLPRRFSMNLHTFAVLGYAMVQTEQYADNRLTLQRSAGSPAHCNALPQAS